MKKKIGFPRDLLEKSIDERLNYFESYTMAHPFQVQTLEKVKRFIFHPGGVQILNLFGVPGVGKSKLIECLEQLVWQEMAPLLELDHGQIPIVIVKAPSPQATAWNWADYHFRLLNACKEPLIKNKILPPSMWRKKVDGANRTMIQRRMSGLELQYAAEKTLENRKLLAVVIDEAQHLAKIGSGRKLLDQLDYVKSLAERTRILHILVGPTELLSFRNLSGQLSRRSKDIPFERYRFERKQDMKIFKGVILTFQIHLPIAEEPDLVSLWEYLYFNSLGCVGILKQMLLRALTQVITDCRNRMTNQDLKDAELSESQLEKIAAEAAEFDALLTQNPNRKKRIMALIGMDGLSDKSLSGSKDENTSRRLPVGVANPKRYPVGGFNNEV